MDARRVADGKLVCLKRVATSSAELNTIKLFSQDRLQEDFRNHCMPVLDSFQDDEDGNISYLVMPFMRKMDDPRFHLVSDIVDFIDQVLEVSSSAKHSNCVINSYPPGSGLYARK